MIDYPDAPWTKPQLLERLSRIACLLHADSFKPSMPFTRQSQFRWIELIRAVSDLVRQAALAGRRICFTDEVSNRDEHQDITSLLDAMRQSAHVVGARTTAQQNLTFISPTLNHVNGVASGHFANGLSFACPHKNERAFFIGRDRIYFYRHLMRAYLEAGQYLVSSPDLQ